MSYPCWGEYRIEPLESHEVPELATALAALDPWNTLGYSPAALTRYLTRPDPALHRYALRARDTTAGVLSVRHPWLLGPYLELLAILPAHQDQGLGRKALRWIEEHPEWHPKNVWVTVSDFNERARAFYRRAGYCEVAALPGLVSPGRAEILLRKEIAA